MNRILLLLVFLLLAFFQSKSQNYNISATNTTITTCAGNFYDSGGGAGQYGNNERDTLTLCSGISGQCLNINFTAFDLEANFDFLRIYNGPNTASPLIGSYTGTTIPPAVYSSTGCLTFVFSSDGTGTRNGWAASISCGSCPGTCTATCSGGPPPANDACSGAQNLGALPVPAACPNGVAAVATYSTTNLCATAEFPYSSMLGCQPNGNMASPALDVWYRFTIIGPTLNVNIVGGLQTPEVGLYEGTNCNNMIARGCAIGSNGILNTTFGGLAPGTYYLQVSGGSATDQCNFNLSLQNNYDCAGCVIQSNLVVNPPPVNGTYQAGQTVNFCYTISDYNQTSVNWLHAVTPRFGPGWNTATLTTVMPANCSGQGYWEYLNSTVTSTATGLVTGPGFFYESALGSPLGVLDGNPGNNFGDNNPNNLCDWTFCWTIQTVPPAQCVPGLSCNVSVDTYGDGESGSWGSLACTGDPITNFFATLTCCTPPVLSVTNINCALGTATATITGQGTGPWHYTWLNGGGTVIRNVTGINGPDAITNLSAGTYTVQVVDSAGCSTQRIFTVSSPTTIVANISSTPVTCNGGNNGTATVVATGGSSGFTYSWAPNGGTSATATGLTAGTYTVTVTDANGCTQTASVVVAQPPALTAVASSTPANCNGSSNGTISVVAGGGSPGYTYLWSSGRTTATATGIAAGTYTVTVTDSHGCTRTASTTVSQPPPITFTTSSVSATCGGTNGSASVVPSGGTPGYTYLWSPLGGTAATATGLAAGSYSVTITDSHGCTAVATIAVSNSSGPTTSITSSTSVSCFGGTNATATAGVAGGTGPFTYSWSPYGGNGLTAVGLGAGTFTITVTDANGCQTSSTVVIAQPPAITAAVSSTPANCNGGNSGTATVVAGGGTPGYTYSWAPLGGTNATANGLTAGLYTVTITDSHGCAQTATTTVTQPTAISAIASSTPVNCNGGANGTASVLPSGGTPGYTYNWVPNGGTGATATGLSPGTYTVTVTDSHGCTQTSSTTVTQPATVTANASATPVNCNGGNNGSATVLAGGGTPGYSYLWVPLGGTNATASGLAAGTYTVTVTDSHGCTQTSSATVTQPAAITASASSTPVNCNAGNNGTAAVVAGGGTPGYTYLWAPNGGTAANASSLTAGTYTVTVTDAHGCTQTASTTISQPPALTASFSSTPVNCNGGTNGTATTVAGGGTPGYIYSWSPLGGTNATATGLSAGAYVVTITDAHGCTQTASGNIAQPPAVTVAASSTPVSCNGGSNGTATALAGGGTPGYTYNWVPNGGTGATATGLAPGSYTVTVTDAHGCSQSSSTTVAQPAVLTANASATPANCNAANNGSATVVTSGGTPGYTYNWVPNGGANATASGLAAGTYTVTVTDSHGCTQTASATVTQPTAMTASASSTPVNCNAGNNGTAAVVAGGGSPGYTYLWAPNGGTSPNASSLTAGTYTVTVTDSHGCTQTATTTISQPPALTASASSTPVTCNGGTDGTAAVVTGGGTPGYTYSWAPSGGFNATASGLASGTYTITVTDAHGCVQTATTNVVQPSLLTTAISPPVNVSCNGGNNGSASVTVNGGSPAYTYVWFPGGGNGATASNLTVGLYSVTVTDSHGCIASSSVTINQPAPIALQTSFTPALCGASNGSASVVASGGTPGYAYSWSPNGGTTANATGLAAGAYTVTVTDAHGCQNNAAVNIANNGGPTATASITSSVTCHGGNNGSAHVTIAGGTGPFSILWSPGGSSSVNATGLSAGNYSVTVTDGNGCVSSGNILITEPPVIVANASATNALCNGANNGSASVLVAGGVSPYSYSWSPLGGTTATASGLAANTYTVTITDANGCTQTASAVVGQPPALTLGMSASPALCHGGNTGSASVLVNGGTPGYSYSWAPLGGSASSAAGLAAGTYTVTVTDAHGCISSNSVPVAEPNAISLVTNATPSTCGAVNGSASVVANGGTPGYTYSWSPNGGTTANATGLAAGAYTITVTDAHGCQNNAAVNIANTGGPTATATITSSVTCHGGNNGAAHVTIAGGTGPFTILWNPGGSSSVNATGLAAGNYSVTVTDGNGCVSSGNVVITEPPAIVANTSATNALCNGANNGSASVLVAGGVSPYSYSWSPLGGTTATASGLAANTYTVTITDANGCTQTASAVVGQPPALALGMSSSPALCHGGNTGSASVLVNGGTPGYSYSWAPLGGSASSAAGLAAGTYTVTVTDAHGCISSNSVPVAEPNAISLVTNATPSTCGAVNGSASVVANGGTPGYTYSWSPNGGTTANANGLAAGAYSVTVTDNNGCQQNSLVNVPNIGGPTAVGNVVNNVTCFGGNDGSAHVTVTSVASQYNIVWTPSGGSAANATGLSAGNYTVTVTDFNGCVSSDNVVITQPPAIVANTSATDALCNGANNGSASVLVAGGVSPYSYSWSPLGGTAAAASGLAANSYTVSITDANGCTQTASALVGQPPALALGMSASPALCHGGNTGSASVLVNGGTPGYSYSWSPLGGSASSATGLAAGTYAVTVTDAHGCISSNSVPVAEPNAINLVTNATPSTCGAVNGSAAVVASGGTPGYTYSWSPNSGTTANANGLAAGTYTVTVTDINGCQQNSLVNVPNIGGPTAVGNVVNNVTCFGGNDGSAHVTVTSVASQYNIVWTPSGGSAANATGLSAGNYTVTVTDLNGCVSSDNVVITQPPAIVANTSATDALCDGSNDGTASVLVAGGVSPYSYSWSPLGGTAAAASGLAANSYTVSITDANGCTQTASALVGQPPALNLAMNSIPTLCNGGNGSASVMASGGTAGYSYSWSPSGGSAANAAGLAAGTYTVTVTDAHGCISGNSVSVTQPAAIALVTNAIPATCGSSNGSASVVAGGGTPGYSYSWSPNGGTTANAAGLVAAAYTVTVTDANGCQQNSVVNVPNTGGPTAAASVVSNVSCFGGNNASATVNIISGTSPFNISWNPGGASVATATGLSAGSYSVTITDANGCISSDNVTITEPAALSANAMATDALCYGSNSGTASVVTSGGTGPMQYLWSPSGGVNAQASGLIASNYSVTITDANGCTQTASAVVGQPSPLNLSTGSLPTSCFGFSDGAATVAVIGGIPGYSYSWYPSGGSSTNATSLTAGTYTVTVTDSHNCIASDSIIVHQPTAILANATETDALCNGSTDGSASVAAGGGTAPYSYLWSSGSTSDHISGLTSSNYYVAITDAHGCVSNTSVFVGQPAALNLAMATSPALCNGASNGSASVAVTGGTASYAYAWSPSGGSAANATGLSSGNYSVLVTDAHGCLSSESVAVSQPAVLTTVTSATDALCHGSSDGTASVIAAGGTAPYFYSWNPSNITTSHATGLSAASYSVTVTDANGCTQTTSAVVGEPSALSLVMASSEALCFGSLNGSASVSVNGGTPGYSYSWSPAGGSSAIASNLSMGNYTVTVSDVHNCVSTGSVQVAQPTAVSALMTMSPALCNGSHDGSASAIVAGGTYPYQYSWSPSGGTGMTASNLPGGSYDVTITDDHGCTSTSSIAVTAPPAIVLNSSATSTSCYGGSDGTATVTANGGTPGYTYSWSPAGGNLDVATHLSTGTYTVLITDAHGCTSSATAFVSQPTPVSFSVAGAATICIGQPAVISVSPSGGTSPYSYLWSNGNTGSTQSVSPSISTNYTVDVEDANGCSAAIQSVMVTVNPPLAVTADATNVICDGDVATISALATGGDGGPYSYSWNNGVISGISATVMPSHDTTFIVTATDGCGTPPAKDSVSITVNPLPVLMFLPHSIVGCVPLAANFLNYSSTPVGSTYLWDLADNTVSSNVNPSHLYTTPGQYDVSLLIQTPQGCVADTVIQNAVIAYPVPKADFHQSTDLVSMLNSTVEFTDNSIDAISWEWNFGDSSSISYERNPVHQYADTGSYRIRLVVTSNGGCIDTTYGLLKVQDDFAIYVPNAFTPNGDGVNDGFIAYGFGFTDYDMWIIDRWGKQIFHSTSKDQPWDGSFFGNSNICQNDVYEYVITVHDRSKKEHKLIGHVTLVR